MKMNDKMKVIVCGGLAIVLCLIGYSCGSNDNIEEVETEQRQEMQIEKQEELETQEVEEQEIQDESLNKQVRNGEYKFKEEESDNLETAKQIVEYVASESFNDRRYEVSVSEENNIVLLTVHLDSTSVPSSPNSAWNNVVVSTVELSSSFKEAFEKYGITDVHIAVAIGDFDIDDGSYFILTMDGELLVDIVGMKDEY